MPIRYRLVRARHPKTGETVVRAVAARRSPLRDRELLESVCGRSTIHPAELQGALMLLAESVRDALVQGDSVVLPGLGTLWVTVRYAPALPGTFHPRRHLRGATVRFRPDPRLARAVGNAGMKKSPPRPGRRAPGRAAGASKRTRQGE